MMDFAGPATAAAQAVSGEATVMRMISIVFLYLVVVASPLGASIRLCWLYVFLWPGLRACLFMILSLYTSGSGWCRCDCVCDGGGLWMCRVPRSVGEPGGCDGVRWPHVTGSACCVGIPSAVTVWPSGWCVVM